MVTSGNCHAVLILNPFCTRSFDSLLTFMSQVSKIWERISQRLDVFFYLLSFGNFESFVLSLSSTVGLLCAPFMDAVDPLLC